MHRMGTPAEAGHGAIGGPALVAGWLCLAALSPGAASASAVDTTTLDAVKVMGSRIADLGTVTVTATRPVSNVVDFPVMVVTGTRPPGDGGWGGGGGGGGGGIVNLPSVQAIVENEGDPGQPTQTRDPEIKCGQTAGNPIVFSTGNKVEFETDFTAGGEMGLYLSRTYNHYWSGVGLFGQHWLSNFDYSLTASASGAGAAHLWLQRPDGRRIRFNRTASGRWEEDKRWSATRAARRAGLRPTMPSTVR